MRVFGLSFPCGFVSLGYEIGEGEAAAGSSEFGPRFGSFYMVAAFVGWVLH